MYIPISRVMTEVITCYKPLGCTSRGSTSWRPARKRLRAWPWRATSWPQTARTGCRRMKLGTELVVKWGWVKTLVPGEPQNPKS